MSETSPLAFCPGELEVWVAVSRQLSGPDTASPRVELLVGKPRHGLDKRENVWVGPTSNIVCRGRLKVAVFCWVSR